MRNNFAEAMENTAKQDQVTEDFVKSVNQLALEIAARGVNGGHVTETEHQFLKTSTLFMLQGLMMSKGVH